MEARRVQIVTIGNEVLLGLVLDSNSNWLCRQVSGLGGHVERVVVIGDDIDEIAREVTWSRTAGADVVFTVGGLGPTGDDLTLQGVAKALSVPLETNAVALELVRDRYRTLFAEGSVDSADIDDARRKMAVLPAGSVPLANAVGAAPGVLLTLADRHAVISLPGVPAELKDIFANSLAPVLREIFGSSVFVERTIVTASKDESALAPSLQRVAAMFPDVYLKSRPRRFGSDVRMQLTVAVRADTAPQASERLAAAQHALKTELGKRGIALIDQDEG